MAYYEGVVEDITARRQAEQALRESEERYRRLVGLSPDASNYSAYVTPHLPV